MSKAASGKIDRTVTSGQFVVQAKSGHTYEIKGAGSLKGAALKIRRDVDLTKPIASQVMRDARPGSSKKG